MGEPLTQLQCAGKQEGAAAQLLPLGVRGLSPTQGSPNRSNREVKGSLSAPGSENQWRVHSQVGLRSHYPGQKASAWLQHQPGTLALVGVSRSGHSAELQADREV